MPAVSASPDVTAQLATVLLMTCVLPATGPARMLAVVPSGPTCTSHAFALIVPAGVPDAAAIVRSIVYLPCGRSNAPLRYPAYTVLLPT